MSYPGVYNTEQPLIIHGSKPEERMYMNRYNGMNYQCIETCYPVYEEPPQKQITEISLCDEVCVFAPHLPECFKCQTPNIIETEPFLPEVPMLPQIKLPTPPPRHPMAPAPLPPPPPRTIVPKFEVPQISEVELPPLPQIEIPPAPPTFDVPQPVILPSHQPEVPTMVLPPISSPVQIQPPPEHITLKSFCTDYCELHPNDMNCNICYEPQEPPLPTVELPEFLPTYEPELPAMSQSISIEMFCSDYCQNEPIRPECNICVLPESNLSAEPIFSQQNFCNDFCAFNPDDSECEICNPSIDFCNEYCIFMPHAQECRVCQLPEKHLNICNDYCPNYPEAPECELCHGKPHTDINENEQIIESDGQCCYGTHCIPMPRSGICPEICTVSCNKSSSNTCHSQSCINPICPQRCAATEALHHKYKMQFMMWLNRKLTEMKAKYSAMIEACIKRTETLYESELRAIEIDAGTEYGIGEIEAERSDFL